MFVGHIPLALAMLVGAAIAPLDAAEPQPAIVIAGPSHPPVDMSIEELTRPPTTRVDTAFLTEQGTHSASFDGPLLWTVLQKAGVVDPAKHRDRVSQYRDSRSRWVPSGARVGRGRA
jgi:hypothetical protein